MRNSSSLDWLRFMHTPNDYRVSLFLRWLLEFLNKKENADSQVCNLIISVFFFVGVAGFEPTTPCSQSGVIIKDIQLHIS